MACPCSRLCIRTKEHDGCTDVAPDNGGVDVKETSSTALDVCQCSVLCYKSNTHFGCTDCLSNGNGPGDIPERTSESLGACRCSRLCYKSTPYEGCVDNPTNGDVRTSTRSNRSGGSVDARETSGTGLDVCQCSVLCYKSNTHFGCTDCLSNGNGPGDIPERTSESLGACRCSRLCYKSTPYDGCIDNPPNGDVRTSTRSNRSGGSVDAKETSGTALDECRCSVLCYKSNTHFGCTDCLSNGNDPGDIPERTSDSLGACRCSRLCYKSTPYDGCVDTPPTGDGRTSTRSKRSGGSVDVKESSGTSSGVCQCSVLCYRSNTHLGCTDCLPNGSGKISSREDIPERTSDSLGACRCSRLCYKATTHEGCADEPPRNEIQSPCRCSVLRYTSSVQQHRDHEAAARMDTPAGGRSCDPDCRCVGFYPEVPVRERDTIPQQLTECLCDMKGKSADTGSAFSVDSTDIKYLAEACRLTQQDHKLKSELNDLAAREMTMRNTLKQNDQSELNAIFDLRMLRDTNKDLTNTNEVLADKIQDLHLEHDQLSQKIEGPLNRELERIKRKYAEVRCELGKRRKSNDMRSTARELELLKAQLQRTQVNIADLALVNDGVKQEVTVLGFKCDQMEKVLIDQKLNEIEAINKLQQPECNEKECSCKETSSDKSSRVSETPTCSCSDIGF